jgi:hypothetical protein
MDGTGAEMTVSVERLRELLTYNPETGVFVWRVKKQGAAGIGLAAGCVKECTPGHPYRYIHIDGRLYRAHRLAWFYTHESWPIHVIDHIDGDGTNNRISNLREATPSENGANRGMQANNTSGFKGVSFDICSRRWRALITVNGRARFLGHFDDPASAHAAYAKAAEQHHGKFARAT